MTEERFLQLARTYGGDMERWPPEEREAAKAFSGAFAELAESALKAERDLDLMLAADPSPSPSAALRARVARAAPTAGRRGAALRWLAGAGLGLGLAASAAAGVAVGLALAPAGVSRLIGPPAGAGSADLGPLADPAGEAAEG